MFQAQNTFHIGYFQKENISKINNILHAEYLQLQDLVLQVTP